MDRGCGPRAARICRGNDVAPIIDLILMDQRFDSLLEHDVSREFERVGLEVGSCPEVLPGRPDFVLRGMNVAVFVHGCYWHRHYPCSKLRTDSKSGFAYGPKFRQSITRDQLVRRQLQNLGWSVVILWECSLRRDIQAVVQRLLSFVQNEINSEEKGKTQVFVV